MTAALNRWFTPFKLLQTTLAIAALLVGASLAYTDLRYVDEAQAREFQVQVLQDLQALQSKVTEHDRRLGNVDSLADEVDEINKGIVRLETQLGGLIAEVQRLRE